MSNQEIYQHQRPRKIMDQVPDLMRVRHYSIRTERAYMGWIKRFSLFHGKKHPKEMGEPEVEAFLTWLAVDRDIAKSTQNQAFKALTFNSMRFGLETAKVTKIAWFPFLKV